MLTVVLPVTHDVNNNSYGECAQFVDGYSWGPLALADVTISGESAASLPIQVIGDTNFAGTFPIWDLLFGTFRMPEGRLPEIYGKDEQAMPSEIVGQLAYPFRR